MRKKSKLRLTMAHLSGVAMFLGLGPTIHAGKMTIRQLADSSIWIENEDGEGMQIGHEKFGKAVREFYRKEF